jgi:hypothetical protein
MFTFQGQNDTMMARRVSANILPGSSEVVDHLSSTSDRLIGSRGMLGKSGGTYQLSRRRTPAIAILNNATHSLPTPSITQDGTSSLPKPAAISAHRLPGYVPAIAKKKSGHSQSQATFTPSTTPAPKPARTSSQTATYGSEVRNWRSHSYMRRRSRSS